MRKGKSLSWGNGRSEKCRLRTIFRSRMRKRGRGNGEGTKEADSIKTSTLTGSEKDG